MKTIKLTQIFVMILLIFSYNAKINAQETKVWEGNLSTKDFNTFYTGDYIEVNGNIIIDNFDGENLNIFKKLQKCTGNIFIRNNKNLESFKGFESLQFVEGRFSITENPELYNYCALQKKLLTQGIKGVEISKGIFDKWETYDNGYNPSLMNLQNENCKITNMNSYDFSN